MAGITLAQAEAKLTVWMAADEAVAAGQSYSIGGRSLSRADARVIQERIEFWNNMVNMLSDDNDGIIVSQVVPTDD